MIVPCCSSGGAQLGTKTASKTIAATKLKQIAKNLLLNIYLLI